MSRWTVTKLASVLALASLPVGACSVGAAGGTEQTRIDPTLIPIGDECRVPCVPVAAVVEADTFGGLEAREWWLGQVEFLALLPLPDLKFLGVDYFEPYESVAWLGDQPGCELTLADAWLGSDFALLQTELSEDDFSPCPGEEDESVFFETALRACEWSESDEAQTEEWFFVAAEEPAGFACAPACAPSGSPIDDPADAQVAAFFEEAWNEGRFFESDDVMINAAEIADARRDEDYSDAP